MDEEDEGNPFQGNFGKVYNTLKKEIEMIKGSISKNGAELDRQKYKKLISEYRQFKKVKVQHFRFNSAAHATTFGNLIPILVDANQINSQERNSHRQFFSWCRSTLTQEPLTTLRETRRSRRRPS